MGGDAAPLDGATPRSFTSCTSCREPLQLSVRHCPFCGGLQPVDEPVIASLLAGIDWAAELREPVSPSEPKPVPLPAPATDAVPMLDPGPRNEPEPLRLGPIDVGSPSDGPQSGSIGRRVLAALLTLAIGAALLARLAPSGPSDAGAGKVAAVSPAIATAARAPASGPSIPVPREAVRTPRSPAREAAASAAPEPVRRSVRLTRTWKTISLGADRDRPSISIEADGPFRIRARGKLYAVTGSGPVDLDLRGLSKVDLRAAAGPVTAQIVASENRDVGGN